MSMQKRRIFFIHFCGNLKVTCHTKNSLQTVCCISHSSQFQDMCLMKSDIKTLENLSHFLCNIRKNKVVFGSSAIWKMDKKRLWIFINILLGLVIKHKVWNLKELMYTLAKSARKAGFQVRNIGSKRFIYLSNFINV